MTTRYETAAGCLQGMQVDRGDVDHEQPWTSPIGPCPTCGTTEGECRPPGCCATCQRFAEDDLRGPKWRHMDPIWGRA